MVECLWRPIGDSVILRGKFKGATSAVLSKRSYDDFDYYIESVSVTNPDGLEKGIKAYVSHVYLNSIGEVDWMSTDDKLFFVDRHDIRLVSLA